MGRCMCAADQMGVHICIHSTFVGNCCDSKRVNPLALQLQVEEEAGCKGRGRRKKGQHNVISSQLSALHDAESATAQQAASAT